MNHYLNTSNLDTRLGELETLQQILSDAEENLLTAQTNLDNSDPDLEDTHELEEIVSETQNDLDAALCNFGADEASELTELQSLRDDMGKKLWNAGTELIAEEDFGEVQFQGTTYRFQRH